MCPIPGKREQYFQSGIVAWGIGCNEQNPGKYKFQQKFGCKMIITLYMNKFLDNENLSNESSRYNERKIIC